MQCYDVVTFGKVSNLQEWPFSQGKGLEGMVTVIPSLFLEPVRDGGTRYYSLASWQPPTLDSTCVRQLVLGLIILTFYLWWRKPESIPRL